MITFEFEMKVAINKSGKPIQASSLGVHEMSQPTLTTVKDEALSICNQNGFKLTLFGLGKAKMPPPKVSANI